MVTFPASLYKIAIDADGGARIQLDVPKSALGDVVQMSALTEALLEVTVNVKQQQLSFDNGKKNEDEE